MVVDVESKGAAAVVSIVMVEGLIRVRMPLVDIFGPCWESSVSAGCLASQAGGRTVIEKGEV